jgi:hypothetical protein
LTVAIIKYVELFNNELNQLPPRIDAQDKWFNVTPPTILFS